MQSLPLEQKISMSQRRISEWYEHYDGNVYVARSGGKDSDVVGHLVKQMYPDVPHVFTNTGLEFSSVRRHAEEECDVVLYPQKTFSEILAECGYPIISKEVSNTVAGAKPGNTRYERLMGTFADPHTGKLSKYNCEKYSFLLDAPFRISDMCCTYMKKLPAIKYQRTTTRYPILGLMAEESRKRKDAWMKTGCNAFEKENPQSQPIAFWTEQDVLHYIKKYEIKIADAYGQIIVEGSEDGQMNMSDILNDYSSCNFTLTGEKRTGCVFCCYGISNDQDRFLRLDKQEPKVCDYVMRGGEFGENGTWQPNKDGLGYWFVLEWLNVHGNLKIGIPNRDHYMGKYGVANETVNPHLLGECCQAAGQKGEKREKDRMGKPQAAS